MTLFPQTETQTRIGCRSVSKQFAAPLLALLLLGGDALLARQRPLAGAVQDMRQNIEFERIGEYHLGPTGAKGWMHVSANFMTGEARQILVTEVAPGSPADGVLLAGDLILGIGGKYFTEDARKTFGAAIDAAETEQGRGVLNLTRWRATEGAVPRAGKQAVVDLKLEVMGSYAETAPYNCAKTKKITQRALAQLLARDDWGRYGDKALALLATGDQKNFELVRDYLHGEKWAQPDIKIGLESGGLVCWGVGYRNLLLTEYYLATGDEFVLPAIREHAVKTAMGQSSGGTWGHGFAWTSKNDGKIHGRLGGYGALNQAGLPCFLSLILAKKCGIEHPEIDAAIGRAETFFLSFVGNGSIGYGFHRPSLEINANGSNGMSGNGKNAIGAVAFRLLGDKASTHFFAKLTASLYNTCEYGHSGNSYSYFWDALGANCAGPANAAGFLRELRWYHTMTRQADGGFVYQALGGIYGKGFLDPTVAQVFIGNLPRKALFITGKEMDKSFWIGNDEVEKTIAAGRWRHADPEKLDPAALIAALDSWSPIAREWIAKRLGEKDGDFTSQLIGLLKSDRPEVRAGACAALGYQGEKSASAVPLIATALEDEAIVAISASYALARINKSAGKALPEMLKAVLATEEDGLMRPVQQAMAFAFGYAPGRVAPLYFDGLLPSLAQDGNPLDGLDREILYPAIVKLLEDPSGRTRGSAAYAFTHFTREDLAAMAQEVYDAVKIPAHHYLMFDDLARQYALDLMLKYRIAEGLPLCLESMDLDRWGKGTRLEHRFALLKGYGGDAKPILPELRELRSKFKSDTERAVFEEVIQAIEKGELGAPLVSLHTLVDEQLVRDLAVVDDDQLRVQICRAQMEQRSDESFYQAACLRLIVATLGAGAVDDVSAALEAENPILREAAERLDSVQTK
ncbi:MAG: HEAT repeat protein [Pseudoalteromonas tetraodonis]|jgi:HEAT repeat protein